MSQAQAHPRISSEAQAKAMISEHMARLKEGRRFGHAIAKLSRDTAAADVETKAILTDLISIGTYINDSGIAQSYPTLARGVMDKLADIAEHTDNSTLAYHKNITHAGRNWYGTKKGHPIDELRSKYLHAILILAGALGMIAFTATNVTGAVIGAPISDFNVVAATIFAVVAIVGVLISLRR